uniref:NADH dehydrogenase [ubiquinone] 1 beta subcomplex subunit 7 n=1 Tax=Callorhinchus milii TaxID=7868 RepID=K4FY48_CALMI|nr:NADH dehydrogenase 1 beta subcomplex subunit 7 [Callorhinchus milii]|eukprot:gi/632977444/ref/XP_007905347.1/ PREDICTED: NADH dehydrogenase [ubiquinone] 1 beta subcomplex subunit 7 [Callorhinchus milii]
MGSHLVRRYVTERETEPDPNNLPTFDPHLGFPERKERVMVASQQEMDDARIPLEQRDYCAHHLIMLLKCKRDNWPNFLACSHENHEWDSCQHQDYVMRMKEYERERRLLMRKKKLEGMEAA